MEQPIFFLLHLATVSGTMVIMTKQMQYSMHDVANHFGLPLGAELSRLQDGFINTDKNFAVDSCSSFQIPSSRFVMVERDHVG